MARWWPCSTWAVNTSLSMTFGEIAGAIEEQDAKALAGLPGIGAATAERMIAKLRRRMPKFALLVAREAPGEAGGAAAGGLSEDHVREMLKEVKDPELFVNVVDLGLIYGVTLEPAEGGKQQVSIDMTMTSPACPAGPQLIGDAKRVVSGHPDVAGVEVRIVMDPPWSPDRMTDDARDQLGIF